MAAWTKEDRDFLIHNRGKMTAEDIAAHMGRTVHSVQSKIKRARLNGLPSMVHKWTPKMDEALEKLYGAATISILAHLFRRSEDAVMQRAVILGLAYTPRPASMKAGFLWEALKAADGPASAAALAESSLLSRKGALRHLHRWVAQGHCIRRKFLRVGGRGNAFQVTFEIHPDAPDSPPHVQHMPRKND